MRDPSRIRTSVTLIPVASLQIACWPADFFVSYLLQCDSANSTSKGDLTIVCPVDIVDVLLAAVCEVVLQEIWDEASGLPSIVRLTWRAMIPC